jgi:acyl-CoA thioesterase-1
MGLAFAVGRLVSYGRAVLSRKAIAAMLLILPLQAMAEEVRILALGDSLTAGYGLPEESGLVPQLQSWLSDQGEDVVIVNAGVSGDTTAGGLSRVEWSLTPEIDAMIVALGGNDVLRGVDPASTRKNLEGILAVAEARDLPVLVIGLQASRNFGADFKAAFDRIHPEVAEAHGALYEPNFFAGLGGDGTDPAAYRAFMQADGIHPNAEGVRRIVAQIGPRVQALVDRVE